MKKLSLILIYSLFFSPLLIKAQERCAFNEYRNFQQKRGQKVSDQVFEKWIEQKKELVKKVPFGGSGTEPDKIPVVVHIIHNGEDLGSGTNISEDQIYSQIEVLNEDYKRLNADTLLTPDEFKPVAGALNIEFVLARRDPNGNPTNGIVRKKGTKAIYSLYDDAQLKSESYWPAEDYLNIWVCDLDGINLGYAQFPDIDLPGLENEPKENRLTDGVVIDYRAFGTSNDGVFDNLKVPYDKGRTATHEIGHYLGLLHTFATQGSCDDDDNVEDTPLQSTDYTGCPVHPQTSCGSVDMFQNFMDYTNDACMNIFTQGQVTRMQEVLDFAPRRNSLLNNIATIPPEVSFYDLALLSINSPSVISCSNTVMPKITIQNKGTEAITHIAVQYGEEGKDLVSDTLTIDSLKSGQQKLLALNDISVSNGHFNFFVNVNILDGEDINDNNNFKIKVSDINQEQDIIPYLERFEVDDIEESQWTVVSLDSKTTWEAEDVGIEGHSAFINLHNYSAIGAKDWLISPALDFSGYSEASLKFRVSHKKFEYTENGQLESFSDSLEVLISSDCGNNFTRLYAGSSDDFKLDNTNDYWEPSSQDDWKDLSFDISDYAGLSNVRIAFLVTNGYGNNIFLDDVEVYVQPLQEIPDLKESGVTLFPNPINSSYFKVGFNTLERQDVLLQIFDVNGDLIQEKEFPDALNQIYTISFEGKRAGVYFVKTKGKSLNSVEKLIVNP